MYKRFICFVFVAVLFFTSAASAELVGWWKLDDGAGNVAVDSSGNGNDGIISGDPEWVAGRFGGALKFDGVDDSVNCGNGDVFNITDELTLAVWVNANDFGSGQDNPWLGKGDTSYMIKNFRTGYDIEFFIYDSGWFSAHYTIDDSYIGEWHHVAGTYDGSVLQIYLDGVAGEDAFLDHTGNIDITDYDVRIGMNSQETTRFSEATLDDCRIYNHALSADEIYAIMVGDVRMALRPRPADGAVDVAPDTKLVWNPGIIDQETNERYDEHHIYLGTVFEDVNTATEPTAILDVNEYTPTLDYDTTYYWRVDESSDADPQSPIKGNAWSFTTANYIVLEDFESYTDEDPDAIYLIWVDGWGDPTNGSTSGYPDPDFIAGEHYVETDIVHGGKQALPLFYDNTSSGLSEATKTLTELKNWTVDDVITLTLFYYGDAGNSTEPMFVGVNGNAVVYNEDPRATLNNEWTQWDIPMQKFADQGVDLTNVRSISLGLGNKANPVPGGEGHVLFDDIRLSRLEAVEYEPEIESVNPGTANLRLYYAFENNAQDTSGRGLNATVSGNPTYTNSATGFGMAMNLDGEGDFLTLPVGTLISSLNESSFAIWVNWAARGSSWQRIFDFGSGEDINMFLTTDTGGNIFRFAMTVSGNTGENQTSSSKELTSGWHHIAVTIDPATSTHTLYLDGKVEGQNTSATLKPSDLGVTSQNWIGLSQYAGDPYYIGALDEFRIYNKVLTRPEVLYLAGK